MFQVSFPNFSRIDLTYEGQGFFKTPFVPREFNHIKMIPKSCSETFNCSDLSQTIHFKFDRFRLEQNNDYVTIGLPEILDTTDLNQQITDQRAISDGIVLTGKQETGVWVNAKSIKDFRIQFYRKILTHIL